MKTMSSEQFRELLIKVQYAVPADMDADEAQRWILNPKRRILFVADDEAVTENRPAPASVAKRLLESVGVAKLPQLPQFVAADRFKEDTKGAVRIWYLGGIFKEKFLKKTECPCEATDIKFHKLLERSRDPAIMVELGEGCGITLSQFFYVLSKQGKGESGVLLVNGLANVAYIPDDDGIVWAVLADWYAGRGGWYVGANPVGAPSGWLDGCQFLSR
jgi:hypothetical protein